MTDANLLKQVEKAAEAGAKKGARKASRQAGLLVTVLKVLLIAAVAGGLVYLISSITNKERESIFAVDEDVEGKDLTIENTGFLGYTAADFADVVLGDTAVPRKLIVYTVQVSDVVEISKTGLANLALFTKTQFVTYHGTASYVLDLSNLNEYCFSVDNEARTVTMTVQHAKLDSINIPADQIEYGDVERGFLAFGEIKLTPEEQGSIEVEVRKKMEQKLVDDNVNADADRFAKVALWEIVQPIVSAVAPGYTLQLNFYL